MGSAKVGYGSGPLFSAQLHIMNVGFNQNRNKRVMAMYWWNNLEEYMREFYAEKNYPGRTWNSLTGREIEIIYTKKHEKTKNS